jgi:hypothetical protein
MSNKKESAKGNKGNKGWISTLNSKPEKIGYYLTAVTSEKDFLVSVKFWTGEGWVDSSKDVEVAEVTEYVTARTRSFYVRESVEYYKKINMPKDIGVSRLRFKL